MVDQLGNFEQLSDFDYFQREKSEGTCRFLAFCRVTSP